MVKELKVEEPAQPRYTQDQEDQILWEMVYEGAPMPEDLAESLRDRSGLAWMYNDKLNISPSAAAAAMEWDAWHLERGE